MGETRGNLNGQVVAVAKAEAIPEIGRKLPAHKEMESQIISVLLEMDGNGNHAMAVQDTVTVDAFHDRGNAFVFKWIQGRRSSGKPVDMIALVTDIQDNSGLEKLARSAYGDSYVSEIAALATKAVSTAHFKYWLAQIKDAWIRRKAIMELTDGIEDLYDPKGRNSEQIVADIQTGLAGVTVDFNTVMTEAEVVNEAVGEIESEIVSEEPPGYTSGFSTLDAHMSIGRGEVIVVAAPTSVGKTTFALQIMDHLATAMGSAMFFTKEMGNVQLMKRLISQDTSLNLNTLTAENKGAINQINEAAHRRRTRNRLYFRDTGDLMNIGVIETITNVMVAKGVQAIAVDYLQLMEPTKETAKLDRRMQIVDITRRFKQLARKLNIPILLISQIERPDRKVKDWKPSLRSLSESKTIEEDADKVIFITRDLMSDQAQVKVAKDREGPTTGWLDMDFHMHSTSFADRALSQPSLPLA